MDFNYWLDKNYIWLVFEIKTYLLLAFRHGVAGYDRLVVLQSPYGLLLYEKLYPQRLHVKRFLSENLLIKVVLLNQ